ncbi:hypothetical protein PR048_005342 [Dryococelus australis]|uniref:Uncharacterized protein n=1 Tax=Dryococelus australis TaxID=614101 RepID=A0ABQ9I8U7_9NEOP|nr:hypothetical protein PR048_005342 [Dryococelus australis]
MFVKGSLPSGVAHTLLRRLVVHGENLCLAVTIPITIPQEAVGEGHGDRQHQRPMVTTPVTDSNEACSAESEGSTLQCLSPSTTPGRQTPIKDVADIVPTGKAHPPSPGRSREEHASSR